MNIILVELPAAIERLKPFSYTRPLSHLRVGLRTLQQKWQHYLPGSYSLLTAPHLAHKFATTRAEANLCIDGTICPDSVLAERIRELELGEQLVQGNTFIACCCDVPTLRELQTNHFERPVLKQKHFDKKLAHIQHPWDIFLLNEQEIYKDFRQHCVGAESAAIQDRHTVVYQPADVFVAKGATVRAAVLNAEEGPIYIGKDVVVQMGATIQGPVALCDHVRISAGANIYGGTTIGPYSKVGGEVRNTVILGHTNKVHEGFLGNAVIGEWCNLGAGTHASNLRNDYADVKVWSYADLDFMPTGLQFCGLLMGDHSKCAINTAFNTGTTVGVSANVFGNVFAKRFIPSFTWGDETYQLDKALATAARMMHRRSLSLAEEDKEVLRYIYSRSSIYRATATTH